MSIKLLATTLVAFAATLPAAAQQPDPEARIRAALERAAATGIPTELIQIKVAEGLAKRASPEQIADAVERREAGLARAASALAVPGRADLDAPELSAGADALDLGVSEAVLRVIAETSPEDQRFATIVALTELVVADVVPEHALERVMAAFARRSAAGERVPDQAGAARERRGPRASGRRGPPEAVRTGPPDGVPTPGQRPGRGRGRQ